MSTMDVVTFRPPQGCRGEDGPAFQGNFRKGELRGIIHINKDNCVGCDTCRKFCPVDAISGGLGAIHKIRDDACVSCGQCLSACPFGAIEQMSFVDDVIAALKDPKKFVVAHPSPAVRVALAEEFGGKPGDLCTDQMLNALEKAGFTVYDVNQTADQTILEEGTEFIKKVRYWCLGERSPEVNMMAHHPLPHFTSCCPGWVRNMEINFASAIPHVSTTKMSASFLLLLVPLRFSKPAVLNSSTPGSGTLNTTLFRKTLLSSRISITASQLVTSLKSSAVSVSIRSRCLLRTKLNRPKNTPVLARSSAAPAA